MRSRGERVLRPYPIPRGGAFHRNRYEKGETMTHQHTPEPWAMVQHDYRPRIITEGARPYVLAEIRRIHYPLPDEDPHDREADANARRIVACVNACAGIPDPEKAIPALVEALRKVDKITGSTGGAPAMVREFKFHARQALAMLGEGVQA